MELNRRFLVPAVFAILGVVTTIVITLFLAAVVFSYRSAYDLTPLISGCVQTDVRVLLYLFFPIYLVIFFILSIPIALLMMVFTKLSRSTTYELGIFSTGKEFSPIRMIRRAIVPSLFALSSSEIVLNLLPDWLFRIPVINPETDQAFIHVFDPLQTIIGALLTLVVGLVLFAPTWILNDSGIVTQVKPDQMTSRRCPDSEGVGRWYSNLFGGFAILAYPITMFYRYFYSRYIIRGFDLIGPNLVPNLLVSMFWIIGIPLLIMSFVMPFIILNELELGWVVPKIQRFARALGGKDVKSDSLMVEMMEVQEHLGDESSDNLADSDIRKLKRK